jgi:hypothetical protein
MMFSYTVHETESKPGFKECPGRKRLRTLVKQAQITIAQRAVAYFLLLWK